jgi:cytoplasmic iron level regulating protein YaaA (DUF328/UPF0246 family)
MNIENSTEFLKHNAKIHQGFRIYPIFLKRKISKILSRINGSLPKLADENWERNQKWSSKPTAKNSAPAMFAFTGEVYRGLMRKLWMKKR